MDGDATGARSAEKVEHLPERACGHRFAFQDWTLLNPAIAASKEVREPVGRASIAKNSLDNT
jgi:hypothetical protein